MVDENTIIQSLYSFTREKGWISLSMGCVYTTLWLRRTPKIPHIEFWFALLFFWQIISEFPCLLWLAINDNKSERNFAFTFQLIHFKVTFLNLGVACNLSAIYERLKTKSSDLQFGCSYILRTTVTSQPSSNLCWNNHSIISMFDLAIQWSSSTHLLRAVWQHAFWSYFASTIYVHITHPKLCAKVTDATDIYIV